MNYELCKQLKDAGFPYISFQTMEIEGKTVMHSERYPTLSELIGACGDGFTNLTFVTRKYIGNRNYDNFPAKKWVCGWSTNGVNDLEDGWEQEGNTPEEAVANLWLALNKK